MRAAARWPRCSVGVCAIAGTCVAHFGRDCGHAPRPASVCWTHATWLREHPFASRATDCEVCGVVSLITFQRIGVSP